MEHVKEWHKGMPPAALPPQESIRGPSASLLGQGHTVPSHSTCVCQEGASSSIFIFYSFYFYYFYYLFLYYFYIYIYLYIYTYLYIYASACPWLVIFRPLGIQGTWSVF